MKFSKILDFLFGKYFRKLEHSYWKSIYSTIDNYCAHDFIVNSYYSNPNRSADRYICLEIEYISTQFHFIKRKMKQKVDDYIKYVSKDYKHNVNTFHGLVIFNEQLAQRLILSYALFDENNNIITNITAYHVNKYRLEFIERMISDLEQQGVK